MNHTKPAKEGAMIRAMARVNPVLEQNLRDDIANFTAMRRRCELQLTGEIKTRVSPATTRRRIRDLDADIARMRQHLAAL